MSNKDTEGIPPMPIMAHHFMPTSNLTDWCAYSSALEAWGRDLSKRLEEATAGTLELQGKFAMKIQEVITLKAKLEDAEAQVKAALESGILVSEGQRGRIIDLVKDQDTLKAQADALAEALEKLKAVVIGYNRLGASWGPVFDRMMSALSDADKALAYREGR